VNSIEEMELRGRLRGLEHGLATVLTFLLETRCDIEHPGRKIAPVAELLASDLASTAIEADGPIEYRSAMIDALKELGRAVYANALNLDELQKRK
jgi:hypothetical protein